MTTLADVTIRLDGEEYRLARQQATEAALGPSARRWSVEKLPIATKRQPRANVRPGDIAGEYVITYDDWSKGCAGDHSPIPGTHFIADGLDVSTPGAARLAGVGYDAGAPVAAYGADPCAILKFNGEVFALMGRYCVKLAGTGGVQDADFGAGVYATDAIVHNNTLIVAFGGSGTNYIRKRDTAGNWTTDDDVLADYFTVVEGRLWRAAATNEVSNIAPTDDPFTVANWSSGLTVGDDDVPITDLNAYGEKLAVSKEDGLYLGDEAAVFPNVLPQLESTRDTTNGRGTLVSGSRIFYPYRDGGLVLYENGQAVEVSIKNQMDSIEVSDTDGYQLPGFSVSALAAQGEYVWAVCQPSWFPRADVRGFEVTTDNGASYTSYLTEVNDNTYYTVAVLDSLDTAANGHWFVVGYSSRFYGVLFDLRCPNANTATLTVEYWNGTAWTAFPNTGPAVDMTTVSGKTLNKSGIVRFSAPAGWAQSTINSIAAYWVRFSVSAALDSEVEVRSCRAIIDNPRSFVYRGRPRKTGDVWTTPIVWEMTHSWPHTGGHQCAALVVAGDVFPYNLSTAMLIADRAVVWAQWLNSKGYDQPLDSSYGYLITARDDAGMPQVNKQWLEAKAKGKAIDSTRYIDVSYRTNETSTWTDVASADNIKSSPWTYTFSGVTGYSMQLQFGFDDANHDEMTEINEIELRFRVLDTWKNQYTMLCELADGGVGQNGNPLPEASVQLAALEALLGAGTKTLYPPVGSSKSVTVDSVRVVEYLQEATEYPVVLVEVVCTEV